MNEYLNKFVAAPNIRASAASGELALLTRRCKTDQFSRSFVPAAARLWNLLPTGVFSNVILSCFKSGMNLCSLRA